MSTTVGSMVRAPRRSPWSGPSMAATAAPRRSYEAPRERHDVVLALVPAAAVPDQDQPGGRDVLGRTTATSGTSPALPTMVAARSRIPRWTTSDVVSTPRAYRPTASRAPAPARRSLMGHAMFTYDPGMGEAIFEYCRDRLALDPVPLDFGGIGDDPSSAIEGLHQRARATTRQGARAVRARTWPRPSSRSTARGSSRSSRTPRPRRRCSST